MTPDRLSVTVIQDEWCVIINVSVIGRPYIVGLNQPSAFKLPLSLTLTGLVGGDPVLSARVAINEILRQMKNYGFSNIFET